MLPDTLTFVRHGESEGNVGTKLYKNGYHDKLTTGYYENHDSHVRLTQQGIEQARAAGEWLLNNPPPSPFFDYLLFVSPYVRTRETAAHLFDGQWWVEPLLRERDWGEVSRPHPTEGTRISDHSATMRELNPWYWKPQGGESLSTDVTARVNMFMQRLDQRNHRNMFAIHDEHVIAVSHGEYLRTVMAYIEQYGEEAHNRMIREKSHPIPNAFILQYTRVNPENPKDEREMYTWRRAVCPWDIERSWDNGEWTEFSTNRSPQSSADLLNYVEQFPHIF